MMRLHTYVNEILDIAKFNNMSFDIGADMLLANVRNYGKPTLPFYKGAAKLNYTNMKNHIKELENSKPDFVVAYRKHMKEIIALRKQGNFKKARAIMEAEK